MDILDVDNTAVREAQIRRLEQLRANRDEAAVQKALADITECVKTKKGNLLELAVKAAACVRHWERSPMLARWL